MFVLSLSPLWLAATILLMPALAVRDDQVGLELDMEDQDSNFVSIATEDKCWYRNIEEEWAEISANNTRKVYNAGIASLLSWASIQFSNAKSKFPSNQNITQVTMATVKGLKRKLVGCWRYQSMSAFDCEDPDDPNECPDMTIAYFELKEENWKALRTRECGYDVFVDATVVDDDAPEGYYFAWGNFPNKTCSPEDDAKYPKYISQSYWDFIIGGIFSWDGQLLDDGYYTWDWTAEEAFGEETMKGLVHRAPSLTYEERRNYALQTIQSTQFSPEFEWVDDRKCPFTGNAPMTTAGMLGYEHDAFKGTNPLAIGTVSPIMSEAFYKLVDDLLIEGGWAYEGARNTIDNRTNPCGVAADQNHDRSRFEPNPYYDTILRWREKVGFEGDHEEGDHEEVDHEEGDHEEGEEQSHSEDATEVVGDGTDSSSSSNRASVSLVTAAVGIGASLFATAAHW